MNASLRLDAVDRLALGFLGLGTSLFVVGLLVDPQALTQVLRTIVDEWTPGFVIDGLLLLVVNRIIRDNERKAVLAQVGSLSNDFALDAVRRSRQEGWLEDGAIRGATLRKAALHNADLSSACLQNADLRYSDLSSACLTYANLQDADLTGCNLRGADLRWADLRGARCNWADLTLALLEGANLDGACFECAAVDTEFAERHPDQHTFAGGHLSQRQVELVRSTFAQLEHCGSTAIDLFYQNLFAARPDLAAMFSGSRRRQSQKFLVSLKVIVTALGQPERSIEVLEQLGRRHAGYGVRREHYDLAGGVLMETLAQYFGPAFTDETAEAWKRAFDLISGVMRGSDVQPQHTPAPQAR